MSIILGLTAQVACAYLGKNSASPEQSQLRGLKRAGYKINPNVIGLPRWSVK